MECTGLDWTRLNWTVLGSIGLTFAVLSCTVVRLIRMIKVAGWSGGPGDPGGQSGQDDLSRCIQKIYGFHGLNHQIIEKSRDVTPRVAEVAREHGWHPPKSLDSDENFKPEHTFFCGKLRFVAIYALCFGDLWA